MRKDRMQEKNTTALNTIQSYHEGSWNGNYAYQGFGANKYFTSDRFIKLDENFCRPDGKPLQGFGLEIETECTGVCNQTVLAQVFTKIIFDMFPADLFKMQRDGSLQGDSSAECITQVMTREFIRNNYANFKAMYNTYFPSFGISCTANCGMHVNISNAVFGNKPETQEEAIKKLLYFVNKNYSLACKLFHRDTGRTYYCRQMAQYTTKEACKAANLSHMPSDHGVAFNMGHFTEGRIELRIVGGQKNYGCFRNTMETVFHVIDACKRLSWKDMDDMTKVFDRCNRYVLDRLVTMCAGEIDFDTLRAIQINANMEIKYI